MSQEKGLPSHVPTWPKQAHRAEASSRSPDTCPDLLWQIRRKPPSLTLCLQNTNLSPSNSQQALAEAQGQARPHPTQCQGHRARCHLGQPWPQAHCPAQGTCHFPLSSRPQSTRVWAFQPICARKFWPLFISRLDPLPWLLTFTCQWISQQKLSSRTLFLPPLGA